jgi:hypothetical protein
MTFFKGAFSMVYKYDSQKLEIQPGNFYLCVFYYKTGDKRFRPTVSFVAQKAKKGDLTASELTATTKSQSPKLETINFGEFGQARIDSVLSKFLAVQHPSTYSF